MRSGRVGSDPIGAWLERPITVLSARPLRPCRHPIRRVRHSSQRLREASSSSTAIIIGVDTHKFVHVAVAIDHLGTSLASCSVSADCAGYAELLALGQTFG